METSCTDANLKNFVQKNAKMFLFWNGHLFRRMIGPYIVLEIQNKNPVLKMFHDEIGHWNAETKKQFVIDRIWWSSAGNNIPDFVQDCFECQKSKPILKCRTTIKILLTGLFGTFSIDFAEPLPKS